MFRVGSSSFQTTASGWERSTTIERRRERGGGRENLAFRPLSLLLLLLFRLFVPVFLGVYGLIVEKQKP